MALVHWFVSGILAQQGRPIGSRHGPVLSLGSVVAYPILLRLLDLLFMSPSSSRTSLSGS